MKKIFILVILMVKLINPHTYQMLTSHTADDISDSIIAANDNAGMDTILAPDEYWYVSIQDSLPKIKDPIRILGYGFDRTVWRDSTTKAWNRPVLWLSEYGNVEQNDTLEVSGIHFKGGIIDGDSLGGGSEGVIYVSCKSWNWRIHNCFFDSIKKASFGIQNACVYHRGVVDHCYARWSGQISQPKASSSISTTIAEFDSASNFGGDRFIFFEDLSWTSRLGFIGNAVDGSAAVRYVTRYNYYVNRQLMFCHGTCINTQAGTRAYEVYKCRAHFLENFYVAAHIRGGTGLLWENSVTGPFNNWLYFDNRRTQTDSDAGGCNDDCTNWDRCDGDGEYDGNDSADGYPCFGQIGWVGQSDEMTREPVLLWDNDSAGVEVTNFLINPAYDDCDNPPLMSDHLEENREWYPDSNAIEAGWYEPAAWPHRLVRITPACSTKSENIDTVSVGDTITLVSKASTGFGVVDSSGFYDRDSEKSAGCPTRSLVAIAGSDTLEVDTIYPHNGAELQDSLKLIVPSGWDVSGKQSITVINGDGLSYETKDSVCFSIYKHDSNTHRILDTTLGIIQISTWPSKVYVDTSSDDETWGVYDSTQGVADFIDTIAPVSGKYHRTRATTYKVVE